jgi:hypothetical protein
LLSLEHFSLSPEALLAPWIFVLARLHELSVHQEVCMYSDEALRHLYKFSDHCVSRNVHRYCTVVYLQRRYLSHQVRGILAIQNLLAEAAVPPVDTGCNAMQATTSFFSRCTVHAHPFTYITSDPSRDSKRSIDFNKYWYRTSIVPLWTLVQTNRGPTPRNIPATPSVL